MHSGMLQTKEHEHARHTSASTALTRVSSSGWLTMAFVVQNALKRLARSVGLVAEGFGDGVVYLFVVLEPAPVPPFPAPEVYGRRVA